MHIIAEESHEVRISLCRKGYHRRSFIVNAVNLSNACMATEISDIKVKNENVSSAEAGKIATNKIDNPDAAITAITNMS